MPAGTHFEIRRGTLRVPKNGDWKVTFDKAFPHDYVVMLTGNGVRNHATANVNPKTIKNTGFSGRLLHYNGQWETGEVEWIALSCTTCIKGPVIRNMRMQTGILNVPKNGEMIIKFPSGAFTEPPVLILTAEGKRLHAEACITHHVKKISKDQAYVRLIHYNGQWETGRIHWMAMPKGYRNEITADGRQISVQAGTLAVKSSGDKTVKYTDTFPGIPNVVLTSDADGRHGTANFLSNTKVCVSVCRCVTYTLPTLL